MVSSYIAFLSVLISSEKHVAWLRSKKLIETTLVDDDDVARLMNEQRMCAMTHIAVCAK